jgi:hypothetical protein
MSLPDLLPQVRELSRGDKLRLIRTLADELEREEAPLLSPDQRYEVWSPFDSYEAAAQLQQFLDRDGERS